MSEEKVITEEDLEGLLEQAKGESAEPVVETAKEEAKEPEVEIELETGKQEVVEVKLEKEGEGVELEVEIEPEVEPEKVIEPEVVSTHTPEQPEQIQQQTQAIQPITPQTGLVAPVCSVEESVRIFKEFEQAKSKILTGNDVLWIGSDGRPAIDGQGSPHIKRSGWRKLARFFGLSWDIENIEKLSMENGGYMYKVRVKVWHPAGASVITEGVATSRDSFFTKGGRQEAKEENVLMKAQTVAVNRAISDILGSGEVSGEERE
ncbi:hypothetical protein KAW50_07840 [candidate division WOR-3 bacterium]|nr:hypothetical protein [candidate division WOR-3 bacterium]